VTPNEHRSGDGERGIDMEQQNRTSIKALWALLAVILTLTAVMPAVPAQASGAEGVGAISAGDNQSLLVAADSSLWAWGSVDYNMSFGQSGSGLWGDLAYAPTKIMDGVASASAGGSHSMVIKNDGSLWAWGYNGRGQLGNGSTSDSKEPIKIMDGAAKTVTANNGGTTVVLTIGSATPTVNGSIVEIDQPGILLGGRTLVPLRFVAEAFGVAVDWDAAAHKVAITS